jgi:hypothetical protein
VFPMNLRTTTFRHEETGVPIALVSFLSSP